MFNRKWIVAAAAGLISASPILAGLVTSTTTSASGFLASQTCSLGGSSVANCSASVPFSDAIAQGLANYGSVQASIAGDSTGRAGYATAYASATLTDFITIYGGSGTGMLTETIQRLQFGTGSLQSGTSAIPRILTSQQSFTFGTAFAISLTAIAQGTFSGVLCDAGTLTVSESLLRMSVTDAGGKMVERLSFSDSSSTHYSIGGVTYAASVPEPAAWVLMLIGILLVGVFAKAREARRE